jgi:hypothetical protein
MGSSFVGKTHRRSFSYSFPYFFNSEKIQRGNGEAYDHLVLTRSLAGPRRMDHGDERIK